MIKTDQINHELSGYLLGKNRSTLLPMFHHFLCCLEPLPPPTAKLGLRSVASLGGRSAAREGGGVLSRTIFVGCGLVPYTYQGGEDFPLGTKRYKKMVQDEGYWLRCTSVG